MRGVKRNAADAALDAAANAAGVGAGAGVGVDVSAGAGAATGAGANVGLELHGGGDAGGDDDDDRDHGHDGDEGEGLGPMGDDDNLEDDDDDDGGLDDGSLLSGNADGGLGGLGGDGAGSASGGVGMTVHHKPHNFRRKINIEFIEDRNRRHITFSKRKAGIMKKVRGPKTTGVHVSCLPARPDNGLMAYAPPLHVWQAYELSTLTGTQVLLLVASETGHVYTFATPKLQPLITKPDGKNLIQACLNTPDLPPPGSQVQVRCEAHCPHPVSCIMSSS